MKTRNAALDLSRFLAAFIVLTGHFLYFDSNLTEVAKINLFEIFHTGAKSVEYFFALSGYVLTRSLSSINISWLKARFVRLMPIYIFCYVMPIIGVLALVPRELNSQSPIALLFGITGLQAISSSYYLIGANSPLWSLSVELYLSIFLLFFIRIKTYKVVLILALTLSVTNIFITHPILSALPYFLAGIGISILIENTQSQGIRVRPLKVLLSLMVLAFWIVFPIAIPSLLNVKNFQPVVDLFFITATLAYFSSLKLSNYINRISIQLGLRSYVMYASHAPVLRIYNQAWLRLFGQPITSGHTIIYLAIGFISVALGTEILFRMIETKAIRWSTKIKKNQVV